MSIFGGFGSGNQQQNQQPSTGFGGFGSTTPSGGGFGSSGTGFGSNSSTSGGLFGGGNNTTGTNTGFGSGGFGSGTQSSGFGSKPAFGGPTTSSGGLFGGGTATSGSTGFGSFGGQNQASTGFGSSSSGGLFGQQNKTPFGTQSSTGLFGGAGSGSGGFGTGSSGGGSFGASTSAGFGPNTQPQNQGTASTPFSPHTEKDTTTNQNVHYQSITFLQPYQNFSFEELRMADYAQGRRWGNQNGQAGAFGTSTGFGGFGGTSNPGFGTSTGSGGLFGGGGSASQAPFGQSQQSGSTAFGTGSAATGGGIFGQKPTSGLFGNAATTSGQQSGGLFGTSGGTGFGNAGAGGFGSANTGGGLFGQQNQGHNKPSFGFGGGSGGGGGGSNTGSFGTGFGQQNQQSQQNTTSNGTSGAFGTSKPGGLFGNTSTTTSLFGSNQNQQQQPQTQQQNTSPFGGFGQQQNNQPQTQAGGLFGGIGSSLGQPQSQQQQKPGGLFGSGATSTGANLFGQQNGMGQQPQQQSAGLFGSLGTQQQGSTSLFGSKPAASTGGLFGTAAPTATNNTGTSLFENPQQQNQSTSLFGASNQQQPKSLFGGPTTSTGTGTGTSLFGGLGGNTGAQQNQNNSLFGTSTQQQQPLGGSILGSSYTAPQPNQPQSLTTSLNANPYGNDQLFAGLSTPSQSIGPLATPLSSSQKQRKNSILPQYRINPSASSRLITPQKRVQGFGFSYSTYGTPGSSASSSSPVATGGSMFGGVLGRSLGKSFSTSNLRHSFTAEESLLAPGAFSPAPKLYNSGKLKRLQIDRSLNTRPNLFGNELAVEDNSLGDGRKQVTFETSENENLRNGARSESDNNSGKGKTPARTEAEAEIGGMKERGQAQKSVQKGASTNGTGKSEVEKLSGKELAIVPEESSPETSSKSLNKAKERARLTQTDQVPGEYWSKPSVDEMHIMSRDQLKGISHLTIGRENCGQIEFKKADLTGLDLDKLLGGIVRIDIRMAAVYPHGSVQKPARGKGLNVPSLITLENSWPRARAGRDPVYERKGARYEKHLERLKRAKDTEFIDYNPETGVWRFKVQHYTTYGMDYEDEAPLEDQNDSTVDSSIDNLADKTKSMVNDLHDVKVNSAEDGYSDSGLSTLNSSPEDTFRFKKQNLLPGAFDGSMSLINGLESTPMVKWSVRTDDGMQVNVKNDENADREEQKEKQGNDSFEEDLINEYARSEIFPSDSLAETGDVWYEPKFSKPKSILKKSQIQREVKESERDTDWIEELQRTVSPKKQNRQMLKESQSMFLSQRHEQTKAPMITASSTPQFQTSIDVMKSLFAQSYDRSDLSSKETRRGHTLEWPHANTSKSEKYMPSMNENDRLHRQFSKPSWSQSGHLIYKRQRLTPRINDMVLRDKELLPIEDCSIRVAKVAAPDNYSHPMLDKQFKSTQIGGDDDGLPFALTTDDISFGEFAGILDGAESAIHKHEHHVWELASILFDDVSEDIVEIIPENEYEQEQWKIRRDKLSNFWKNLVLSDAVQDASKASTSERKAIAYLSGFDVWDACNALIESKNFRLATLLAQIGQSDVMKNEMSRQIDDWRRLNTLSEIDIPIRTLYELIAGNTYLAEGCAGVGAENKAESFQIANEFKMDWRRAFGLRLWYGISAEEPLEAAITQYTDDLIGNGELAGKKELVQPVPWFIEKRSPQSSAGAQESDQYEDLLWGLLRLYAAQHDSRMEANIIEILEPQNVNGNPLNARLSFQLLHLLRAKGVIEWTDATVEAADTLASTLAVSSAQIADRWQDAIFVLLHLSSPSVRVKAIQEALYQRAASFDITPGRDSPSEIVSDTTMASLTVDLCIPRAWVYSARALFMRAVKGDHTAEVYCLLAAGDYQTAHQTLCATVAPRAIISRNYDSLRELLGGFETRLPEDPSRTAMQTIKDWSQGGGIYFDFIHLVDIERRRGAINESLAKQRRKLLRRLTAQLLSLKKQEKTKIDLDERAAIWDMALVVAKAITASKDEKHEATTILHLPLSEDMYLKHTREMSIQYYRAAMASAR